MSNLDIIRKGLRIGAFSGLAITIYAVATDSKWLLESKYLFKPREKGIFESFIHYLIFHIYIELKDLSFEELKGRYLRALTRKSEE